jgi:CP family cyanate transporter-like MFS transporter
MSHSRGPGSLLLVLAIVLTAANLRPAFASVGPVLDELRADLGLGSTGAALLTTVPVLCLGLVAPASPRLARRLGIEGTLALALVVLLAGLLVRVAAGSAVLFIGTVAAAGAIAVANVLIPALVKRDFSGRTGTVMGIYTMSLSGFAAVAAGVTVPVGQLVGGGWRAGLGMWAALPVLALLAWVPLIRTSRSRASAATAATTSAAPSRSLLRDPLAWQVTIFFGLQSLSFYAVLAWLPSIYRDAGMAPAAAGLLLSVATLVQAPAGLVIPRLAARAGDQRGLVLLAVGLVATGFVGVLLAPMAAPYVWVALLGAGLGAGFALALLFTVLRAPTSAETARLSAMAQTIGYTLAAAGPFLVGALHAATGAWTAALVLLLALTITQLLTGLGAGRALHVGQQTRGGHT